MKKAGLILTLAAMLMIPVAANAADTWKPKKPITIMTPTPAGSTADMALRAALPELKAALGVPVVVSPTPGGQNTALITKMMAAPHDGYTLIVHGSPRVLLANIFREDPFKYEDLRPVTDTWKGNTLFVQHPDDKDFMQFVERAKANPGKLNVGVMGVKTGYHAIIFTEMMNNLGIKCNIVPFAGAGPIVSGILGKHIDAGFIEGINTAVKPTLLVSGKSTVKELQGIPTPEDLNITPPVMGSISGIFAPADTPDEVCAYLEAALRKAMDNSAELKKVLDSYVMELSHLGSAEYKQFLDKTRATVTTMKNEGKIQMD